MHQRILRESARPVKNLAKPPALPRRPVTAPVLTMGGMPLTAAGLALILPSGGDRWVGLLVAEPDYVAGTYEEAADSGYARISWDAWLTEDNGDGRLRRRNDGAIVFGLVADGDVTLTHWGVFDALTNGNLLAAGPLRNLEGVVEPVLLPVADQARFTDGALRLLGAC